jgi:hypothetical protein
MVVVPCEWSHVRCVSCLISHLGSQTAQGHPCAHCAQSHDMCVVPIIDSKISFTMYTAGAIPVDLLDNALAVCACMEMQTLLFLEKKSCLAAQPEMGMCLKVRMDVGGRTQFRVT